jgi:hypothetical protein
MTLDDALKFLNSGGLLAAFIIAFWTGYKGLWSFTGKGSILERETLRADKADARADKAEADRDRATEYVQEKALPAILNFTLIAREILGKKEPPNG